MDEKRLRKEMAAFCAVAMAIVLACAAFMYKTYANMEEVSLGAIPCVSPGEAGKSYEVQTERLGNDVKIIVTDKVEGDGLGAVLEEMIAGSSDAEKLLGANSRYLLSAWIVLRDNNSQKTYRLPTRYFQGDEQDMTRRNQNSIVAVLRHEAAAGNTSYGILVLAKGGQGEVLVDTGRTVEL